MTQKYSIYADTYNNRTGYGQRRPALILVDFVEAYFNPECSLYATDAINSGVGRQTALTAALRPHHSYCCCMSFGTMPAGFRTDLSSLLIRKFERKDLNNTPLMAT